MSFNQISGKVHGHQQKIKRIERQSSYDKTIPFQQQSHFISENDSCRNYSVNDQSPNKRTSFYGLPLLRKQNQSKNEMIIQQSGSKRKGFFNQVYFEQNNCKEKALSPVIESRFQIKIPKKLSLNRAEQRAQQQQQSIIFNYLNEKVPAKLPKNKKKKKLFSKSAQKQQKPVRIYQFPSSDPRIHRRQKTELKTTKSPKFQLGSILQKRRSLDLGDQQRNLMIIRRQTQTLNKQQRLLDELRKRVNEVEKYQNSMSKIPLRQIPFQLSKKKYSLSNRTMEPQEPQIQSEYPFNEQLETSLADSLREKDERLNKTFQTIQKTSKNFKSVVERKQSLRKIPSSIIQSIEKPVNLQNSKDLIETIKYNDDKKQQSFVQLQKMLQHDLNPSQNSKIQESSILEDGSDQQSKIQIKIDTFFQPVYQLNPSTVEKPKKNIRPNIKLTQPSRIPDKSFLYLKTYYSQISINPKISDCSSSFLNFSPKSLIIRQVPSILQVPKFIEKYTPLNNQIQIPKLISQQNFQAILQQGRELYFGQIKNELKSGIGITIKHNYLYEGQYLDGFKLQGIQITETGKYHGFFKNDKKQGKGKFQWKNGETYDGQWFNGRKNGRGVWQSSNGDTYIGQWVNGKVQGHGIHTSVTGQTYEGSFHDYLKSGWGKEVLPNGDIYEGEFSDGKPNGSGQYTWKQGHVYKGDFKDGFRTGYGNLKDQTGNQFKGLFQKQEAIGKCSINFINQDSYSGMIQKGIFSGKGTLILYEEEQIWKGQWIDDIFFKDEMNLEEKVHFPFYLTSGD